ncbi:E6 [Gammapapillomavirus 14]|uniref:Protein E6 n=1 Tax=Gammapapillomavirus 14 TaxID=1513259 RepID=A0A2D2ALW6_9PAPI|nr:E6 [Gammapapillomavirus 14]
MEPAAPTNLVDYCNLNSVSFFDVKLDCIFCKFPVPIVDLAAFYHKGLSLVYRGEKVFAACSPCLKLCATYERSNYCVCTAKCCYLSGIVGKELRAIVIRCLMCLGALDYIEKLDLIYSDADVYLIRGTWRAMCRNCR